MNLWTGGNLDFVEGQIILLDKPYQWSSFDVVKKVRWQITKKLNIKKIKVGHAGTLDPLATGLLIIATGKYTKLIDNLMGMPKVYTGTMCLGATTPSYDLETEINETFPSQDFNQSDLKLAAQKLTGTIEQVPPLFSAKKIGGKRAYTFAREGREIELSSREVEVTKFEVSSKDFKEINFEISCSKGTYIRSLARDFGLELNSGAHLTSLRREAIGTYQVGKDSFTPNSFSETIQNLSL